MVQADGSLFAFGGVPPTSTMGYDDTTESFKLSTQGPWQLIEGGNMAKVGVVSLTEGQRVHTHLLTPPLCCLYTPPQGLAFGAAVIVSCDVYRFGGVTDSAVPIGAQADEQKDLATVSVFFPNSNPKRWTQLTGKISASTRHTHTHVTCLI